MASVTGIEVVAAGNALTVTFDGVATYSAGVLTISGAQIPFSQLATDRRTFTTTGAPTAGNGTDTHTYAIATGFLVWAGEDIDIAVPSGLVSGQAADTIAATNSSTEDGTPNVRVKLHNYGKWYGGTGNGGTSLVVYVDACGFGGAGNGIASVTVEADDGVNPPVSQAATFQSYNTSAGDGSVWRGYVATLDLSTLNDGSLTITTTVASNAGLGSEVDTKSIVWNGGDSLTHTNIYLDVVSGSAGNTGLTSGSPKQYIGQGIALISGGSITQLATFHFIAAGDYESLAGDAGVATNRLVKFQADIAGVRLTQVSAAGWGARTNNGVWFTSADPDTYTLEFHAKRSSDGQVIQLNSRGVGDRGFNITQDSVTTPATSVSPYIVYQDKQLLLDGATVDNVLAFGASGTTPGVSNLHCWHVRVNHITADPFDNALTVVDCSCDNLGEGLVAFTATYTGAAAATIEKSGTLETGTMTLKEDGTPVLVMDLTAASYDTWTEVVAAIDALADWTCTIGAGATRFPASDFCMGFDAVSVGAGGTDIYTRSTFHADGYQIWGAAQRSVYINGLRLGRYQNPGAGSGKIGEQTWWFDNAGPIDLLKVTVLNVTDRQFIGTANVAIPRSAFHGVIKNCLVALCCMPDSYWQLLYAGGGGVPGSEYAPVNNIFAHNVMRYLAYDASGDGTDVTVFNNHWEGAAYGSQILGDSYTSGGIEAELTDYASEATYDFTPIATSSLVNRVNALSFPDWNGASRLDGGALGATEAAAPTISSISPSSGPVGASGVLTINGTGFVDGAVATGNIGVVALGTTNFISSTQLTVTNYTVNGVGTSDITVTNPDGQAVTSTDAFTGTAATAAGGRTWRARPWRIR